MKRLRLAALVFATAGLPLWAAPTIGTTTATPATIAAGSVMGVVVTSVITDPSLIPTGINLLRLNAGAAPTILGQLHDDGLNGDAIANDHVFSILANFNESNTGQIQLQVSAAFKATLLRVLSSVVTVNVVIDKPSITASLNPSPNAAGWNNSNVTVTFSCTDSTVMIDVCSDPVPVNGDGANQLILGTVISVLGAQASTSLTANVDTTRPVITGTATPSPNAAGWAKTDVTVTFTCSDTLSGISACSPATTVTSEGVQPVTGNSTDRAGNTASASVTVRLDKTGPVISVTAPSEGANVYTTSTTVTGTVTDALSGVGSLNCNGSPALVSGGTFTCKVALTAGANAIRLQAADLAGNTSNAQIDVTAIAAPGITITSPANLSFGNLTPITVSGKVDDPNATVTVNGIQAFPVSGTFSVSVPLSEGTNTLTALATNPGGNVAKTDVEVTLDTTPPHVTVDSPADQSTTTEAQVTVSGMVNDIVIGTVNDQEAQVTVNGLAAQVSNRSYAAQAVPLVIGPNTIQVTARDRVGNSTTSSVTVSRVAPQPVQPAIGQAVVADTLSIVSGNNQTGPIATSLTAPLVVALRDAQSKPVANQPVVFKVTVNDGQVNAGGAAASAVAVNTDANGQAQANWTLGHRSGAGNNTVRVETALAVAPVSFTATGTASGAALIVVDSGNNQTGAVGQPLTFPLAAIVTDSGFNRIPNVPVTFTVKNGGGGFGGNPTVVVNTDSNGRALAVLTLGSQPGSDNNVVEADFSADPGLPATFSASAKTPGNPANTTISGVVLDNSNAPIVGATLRLLLTNQGNNNNLPSQIGTPVQTNAQGTFLISPAPVGFFKLMADGSTASGPKSFPTLEYDIVTVAGQDNTVGVPIYLPALDTVNQLCVDATHGGTLTLPQSPGFSLTVVPGSATFPGGSKTGCISVTPVNGDKVPMSPGFGQQPRFIVTIQPVGTTFNPPAPITLPNADGLKPRTVTEMYSYDHDLSAFVAIGTGTVSDDGSAIASNPGVGVLKAGWHCGGNPQPDGSAGSLGITALPSITVLKGHSVDVPAFGTPPLDGSYNWIPPINQLASFTAAPACPSQLTCTATLKAGDKPGQDTFNVCFQCNTTHDSTCTQVALNVVDVQMKLEKVGDTEISADGMYTEDTKIRITAVRADTGATVTDFTGSVTVAEKGTAHYSENGMSTLPATVSITSGGTAELTISSLTGPEGHAKPSNSIITTMNYTVYQGQTLSVEQWVHTGKVIDPRAAGNVPDWFQARVRDVYGAAGLSGDLSTVLSKIITYSVGDLSGVGPGTLGITPTIATPFSLVTFDPYVAQMRQDQSVNFPCNGGAGNVLTSAVIHEARHAYQDALSATPGNDQDHDFLVNTVGIAPTDILIDSTASRDLCSTSTGYRVTSGKYKGPTAHDSFDGPDWVRYAAELDAYRFTAMWTF